MKRKCAVCNQAVPKESQISDTCSRFCYQKLQKAFYMDGKLVFEKEKVPKKVQQGKRNLYSEMMLWLSKTGNTPKQVELDDNARYFVIHSRSKKTLYFPHIFYRLLKD